MKVSNKRLLLLISLGAILEYYDFAIFVYLAPVIGKSLIPVKNEIMNLALSYTIFAVESLFRPLGGMIFAHLGDTRGRKQTFVITILLMAIPTLLIAFIPNAQVIGCRAIFFLIALRIVQGLAVGGELPGSITFGYELSSIKEKAFNSSRIITGSNIGFFLASVVCAIVMGTHFLNFESWRLAFILGGFFGIGSYFLRKNLVETPAFIEYKQFLKKETVPIKLLFTRYKKPLFQMLAMGGFLASSLVVFNFYITSYLSTFYHFPQERLAQFNPYTIFIFVVGAFAAGCFDKFFSKIFFITFTLIFILALFLLFKSYASLSIFQIICFQSLILLGLGIIDGRFPVLSASFFPVAVRYSGVAFIYNISFGIVTGCTQMILTWLIKVTGLLWIPALYICFFAFLFLLSLISIKSKQLVEYQS